jgi:hypothetical protein
MQGVVVAWMARRMGSRFFQTLAVILGVIGLIKVLGVDVQRYDAPPTPFWNLRFWVGLSAAALFGLQGHLLRGSQRTHAGNKGSDGFLWVALIGLLLIGITDALWTMGGETLMAWSIIAWLLLLVGLGIVLALPAESSVRHLGTALFWMIPLVLVGSSMLLTRELRGVGCFLHGWIWVHLLTVAGIAVLATRLGNQPRTLEAEAGTPGSSNDGSMQRGPGMGMLLLALASGIILVTNELLRSDPGWGSMAVTLFWGICAMTLILVGLKHQIRALRGFGLVLFCFCAAKVILVDSTQLSGLFRIGAYMGSGVMLLVLSWLYQKASAHFRKTNNDS